MAGTFALDISRFVAKAKGNADLVVRKVALDIFRRVIQRSPVDTGRFKSNWLVAIGHAPTGTIELDPKGSAGAGVVSMSRVDAAVLGLKAGDVIFLVNNLEYARLLEYGHSQQAPAGMVRVTLTEYTAAVSRAAGEVR